MHLASVYFTMTCTAEQSWPCVGEMLIRARLFHLPELDAQLVRMITAGRSNLATDLALHLVRTCLVGDPVVTAADLFNTLDTLAKIARHSSNGPAVLMLVEQARQVTRSASSAPQPCCLRHSGGCTCLPTSWSTQHATCMPLRSSQWQYLWVQSLLHAAICGR